MFTTSDAAWALSGLNSYAVTFAYWRYCGDESLKPKVRTRLVKIAGQFARNRKTKLKPTTIIALVDSALDLYERPVCSVCNGKSVVTVVVDDDATPDPRTEKIVCNSCKGHGKKMLSKSHIARIAGLNRRAITSTHESIISDVIGVIGLWERQVNDNVREKID